MRRPPRPFPALAFAALVALGAAPSASGPALADDSAPGRAAPSAGSVPAPAPSPWAVGEFDLAEDAVVDGDTLRLAPPHPTVRVLGLDCEEVFRRKADREAAKDFATYAAEKRGDSKTPVKYGTPAGEAAAAHAKALLRGVSRVRLERDEEGRDRDGYGRVLAHAFFARGGREILLAEETIRAGHSPYFVKYGRSERFDARLVAAQEEAKAAKRGIWGDVPAHYPDYAERLAWWERRAKQVDAWNLEFRGRPGARDRVRLGVEKETNGLRDLLGKRVTLFGSLERVVADRAPRRLLFVDRPRDPFPVVVHDEAVWAALDLDAVRAMYCRVTGTLSEHEGRLQVAVVAAEDVVAR
jgi:endonuclease YncB( thermonuclease family)